MTFHVEFYAKNAEDAKAAVKCAALPDCVRSFLLQGLSVPHSYGFWHVKATGHQYAGNDYARSAAELLVEPLYYEPKHIAPPGEKKAE